MGNFLRSSDCGASNGYSLHALFRVVTQQHTFTISPTGDLLAYIKSEKMSSYQGHIFKNNALTVKNTAIMLHIFRFIFIITLMLSSAMLYAQQKLEFNIVSFELDPFSTTAQDKRYEKVDGDGNRYAIIKVKDANGEGDLNGFTFNFGTLNSIVEIHDDELWVYVQRNAKTVTVKRPGYKTIEKYDLNTTLLPGKTYVMTLTMSRIRKEVVHDITKQVLQFVVSPSNENAIVKVKKTSSSSDFELWGAVDETGSIDKIMDFGTYDYMVSAVNYESSTGRITLSDSKKTFVENVSLKPNFGFLVVNDLYGISGAQIYVDDVKIGTVPYCDYSKRWSCGEHRITITNGELYKTYNSTFTILQGDTMRLSPKLESDFAQTTIRVDADAEIFIDGKSKGRKTWTGPLKAGKYVVECKQDRHRPSSIAINVKADKAETFEVPAPVAITGSLYVSSIPSGATIDIDGKEIGSTPQLIQDLPIGEHKVSLIRHNYKRETSVVKIKEGQTENLSLKLNDIAQMTIASKPDGAKLFINGVEVGTTPYSREMYSGDYQLELQLNRYKSFKELVHLDVSHPHKDIVLERQYLRSNSFYIQPFLQVGSNMSVGGAVGGYISNINIEGYYAVGLNKSEEIWWNSCSNISERPSPYIYKPTYYGVRLGYGIALGPRFKITPQTGMGCVSIFSAGESGDSKGYATSIIAGCKVDYALNTLFGINASLEYGTIIKKSGNFNQLDEISSKIKEWSNIINCRVGLSLYF